MTSPLWNFPSSRIAEDEKSGNAGRPSSAWQNWFQQMTTLVSGLTERGTTAQRPVDGLYIGRMYFDTTLDLPVWVKEVTPAVVWIDAAGNVA